MSFAGLVKKLETKGRVQLRGGQCDGRVAKAQEDGTVDKFTPSMGKGSEYVAKYKIEEDNAYFEMILNQGAARNDVTSNELSQMEQLEELTSIGTLPNLRELNREELTQVYSRYNFDPVEPTEHLESIFNEREKIVQLIESNQVCIINGPTGCGKSTQIPQFILDDYASKQKHCNIVVTQPRRIAAISLAQRVCRERNWGDPGGIVGYQVALDRKAEQDTRILYCTTGVLLERLINEKNLNDYTHILLDEVHERDEDMDFLMLVVRKFLRTNSPNVKVVLMSATIDDSKFAKYFEIVVRNRKESAPCHKINLRSKFSVQLHYLDGLEEKVFGRKLPDYTEDEPMISKEAYELVPMMIKAFNSIDSEDFRCKRSNEQRGAVLIFLPGLHQIETLYEMLSKEDEKQKDVFNFWLCPLHSSITKDEQEKVVALAPRNMRKVILSTNIAESSLTIPDVKFVIDFCLTKHLVSDPITGFTSLQMDWASHTNCEQRKGRVGRVQDGRVYRMVKKNFYQFKMRKESVPEMLRCPLEIVVLKCKRLMEDECPLRLISNALDPPDLDNYEKTILKLKEVGAMLMTCKGKNDPNDGDLTFMGRVMGSLPLDIHITKLILLGHAFDVLEDAIIMGCAMAVRNLFSEPFQRRLDAYNNKLLWADSSECDAIAYLNAYKVWRLFTGLGKFQRSKGSEEAWGRMYMLQIKHLREVSLQEDDIKKRLKHFNIHTVRYKNKPLWQPEEQPLILKLVLAGAFYPNYYSCSAQNLNAEIEAVKMLGGHNPYRCVYLQNMPHPAPLYFDQVKEILHNNSISEDFELHHDSSHKLIVEFNQTEMVQQTIGDRCLKAMIPGSIVMPVYRAIKMRQLNIPLSISIYPQSVAREKLNSLVLKSRSSMISLSGQSSEYRPVIPWDQQILEITVSHVEDAGRFYGQIHPSTAAKLRKVHTLLNTRNLLSELTGEIEESAIYAAPYKDDGDSQACYYRAKVTRKKKQHNFLFVDVLFIDYGNSASMSANDLREIISEESQKELDAIPPLAVECVLAEVVPSHWSTTGCQWSQEATDYVKNILNSTAKNVWPVQVYSCVNGVASVHLFLEEEGRNGMPPMTLNTVLIKKNYARFREESYLSKRNHAKREEIARGEASFDNTEESSIFKTMTKDIMSLALTEGTVKHLKGPHSPLEMKLFSKVKSSCQKEVRVEWNSVNSVLLDSDPTDPHEKLMVAGFASQSADGRKLSLNHTTVLPALDGLSALVCLLFAPTVELRSDEFRSRYIGALCGLGCDPDSGRSLFPENDMEIKFDVEIKEEDLVNVNKLRYNMNLRFCGQDSEDIAEKQIFDMQQNIRELIYRLLKNKRRQSFKVEYCRNPYRWGLVNEDYLKSPFGDTDEAMFTSIYQLHYAIDLNPNNDFKYIQDLVKKFNILMSFVQTDLPPKELECCLCDLNFSYWPQLRDHITSQHHKELTKWLKSRASAHGLSLHTPVRPRSQIPDTTIVPQISKPPTNRQPISKPSTSRH